MTQDTKRRLQILGISILTIFITIWLELFFQKKQYLIGAGISRAFFFLLINLHIIVIVTLLYMIIRQSIKLFVELHRKTPGSNFKKNLLTAFTIFSVMPSFLVFFIAGKLITTSIDDWFAARINIGLKKSIQLHQHQTQKLRQDLKENANKFYLELQKNNAFEKLKNAQDLKEASLKTENLITQLKANNPELNKYKIYLWENNGGKIFGEIKDEIRVWRKLRKLNDRTTQSLKNEFFRIIAQADQEEKIFDFYGSLYCSKHIKFYNKEEEILNLKNLNPTSSVYLILIHRYKPSITYPLIDIQNSISDYEQIKSMRNPIYWNYILTFILLTLLILFLSIWCAFYLARGISKPIQELLGAIEKIRKGDLNVRVTDDGSSDLKNLALGFNEMSKSIQQAQAQLKQQNTEMLMILENIKEAVFFINKFGRILTYNTASKEFVQNFMDITRFKNKKVTIFGEQITKIFTQLVREFIKSGKQNLSKEITLTLKSEPKILSVYLRYVNNYFTVSGLKNSENGLLIIIEDLTDIVKINQMKTWQQAARQMAHEIKNPLTPIQLATQRLQRKFHNTLEQDKVFLDSTDTILNQVKIIRDLVTHFSEFAKMPSGKSEPIDLNETIKEITCLYKLSYPEISFIHELEDLLAHIKMDKKTLKRVIINLLDNSVRAINQLNPDTFNQIRFIKIKTSFKSGLNQIELVVADNGPGIPEHVKDTLFLPYVSGEKKNTGLGLAIVHESITQSGGSIKLLPSSSGAAFQILLPV
jgi:two-component system, NtrC family, nitrogen regulation sensor histidine kinase NtrY